VEMRGQVLQPRASGGTRPFSRAGRLSRVCDRDQLRCGQSVVPWCADGWGELLKVLRNAV
jgi:hypothetical protein